MYRFLLMLSAAMSLMTGCIQDQSDFIGQPEPPTRTSDIFGILQDEQGLPVEGATVTFEGQTVISDIFGVYQFKGVEVSTERSVMRIRKDGYFESSRTFSTTREASIQLKNVLLKKDFIKSFNATTGGSISESNITLDFPPNSIIEKSSGIPYSGQVQVVIKYLDPVNSSVFKQMPGDLHGINDAQAIVSLAGYGIFSVELQSFIGLPLDIDKGQVVKVKNKIPGALLANSPPYIYLWSYEDRLGIWKVSGEMELINGAYEGVIGKLNFWNCSKDLPTVRISGRLTDLSGSPMAHVSLYLSSKNDNFKVACITDKDGYYSQFVPAEKSLTIEFNETGDNCSFNIFQPATIGPFVNNSQVPDIKLDVSGKKYVHLKAELISCAGQSVNNGYIAVRYMGELITYLESVNGSVDGKVLACDDFSKLGFIGVNSNSNEKSEALELLPAAALDLGSISVCKEENDYIKVSISSKGYDTTSYTNVTFRNGEKKALEASLPLDPPFLGIDWTESDELKVSPGIYDLKVNEGYLALARQIGYDFYKLQSGKMTITQGANLPGKSIRGSFKMQMLEAESLEVVQVEGSFKATFN